MFWAMMVNCSHANLHSRRHRERGFDVSNPTVLSLDYRNLLYRMEGMLCTLNHDLDAGIRYHNVVM